MATQLTKLGLEPGARWRVNGAPDSWSFERAPDPTDRVSDGSAADVSLAFVTSAWRVSARS